MRPLDQWDVFEDEEGLYNVSWRPARGHPEYPGHLYSPGDRDLPADFPTKATKENLQAWALSRWGRSQPH
jgi:hypothetical protein